MQKFKPIACYKGTFDMYYYIYRDNYIYSCRWNKSSNSLIQTSYISLELLLSKDIFFLSCDIDFDDNDRKQFGKVGMFFDGSEIDLQEYLISYAKIQYRIKKCNNLI